MSQQLGEKALDGVRRQPRDSDATWANVGDPWASAGPTYPRSGACFTGLPDAWAFLSPTIRFDAQVVPKLLWGSSGHSGHPAGRCA